MNRPSIVEIVKSQGVELRKIGREYKGRCPFHDDKIPSFSASEEKGLFHCFGCGESGDVFDFVMKLDGVGFAEARKLLGVPDTGRQSGGAPSIRPLWIWRHGLMLKQCVRMPSCGSGAKEPSRADLARYIRS